MRGHHIGLRGYHIRLRGYGGAAIACETGDDAVRVGLRQQRCEWVGVVVGVGGDGGDGFAGTVGKADGQDLLKRRVSQDGWQSKVLTLSRESRGTYSGVFAVVLCQCNTSQQGGDEESERTHLDDTECIKYYSCTENNLKIQRSAGTTDVVGKSECGCFEEDGEHTGRHKLVQVRNKMGT